MKSSNSLASPYPLRKIKKKGNGCKLSSGRNPWNNLMVLNCISFYHQVVLNDIPWFLYCWSLLMDFCNVLIPNSIHWFHSCNSKHRYHYVNLRHMYFIFSVLCCPTFNFVLHIIKLAMREDPKRGPIS